MVTRITSGGFLVCGNRVLLMKRGLHKKLAPGLWAGVGGHMDLTDIKDPRALDLVETCYREIYEETGISKADIHNLRLRYVAIRRAVGEIRIHYHHIGEVAVEFPLPMCNEGELYWVDKKDIPGLPMPTTINEAMMHWLANPNSDEVYLIAINKANDAATVVPLYLV